MDEKTYQYETQENGYIDLAKHVLLILFTFGIWYYIWVYRTTRFLNTVKGEEYRDPTNKLLLCMFVPFYSIYWVYKSAQRTDKLARENGVSSDLSTLCLVLAIFVGIVPPILIQSKINEVITQRNKNIKENNNQNINNIRYSGQTNAVQFNIPTIQGEAGALYRRGLLFLEDGDFYTADIYFESVLNQQPENSEAYLGKLMAELKVRKRENLADCEYPFDDRNNCKKAIRFGNEELISELNGYITHINERNKNRDIEKVYVKAINAMNSAASERQCLEAAEAFNTIKEYKNSAELAGKCIENAEEFRKNKIYEAAKIKMLGNDIAQHEEAIELLQSISGYRDSDEQINICTERIIEIVETKEKQRKRNKKIAIIATPIICAVIAFVIVLNTVIIPYVKYNDQYNNALSLLNEGNIDDAYKIFNKIENYKDSAEKAGNIRLAKTKEILKNCNVGDSIKFGAYEQDNNISNGKEDIEWIVLEVKNGKVLVISKYTLDCQPYNTSFKEVTWENCTLRKWLNSEFLNIAFSNTEKTTIPKITVSADKNPEESTTPGNATQDKVFLLSITEAIKYLSYINSIQCKPTDYAVANGAYIDRNLGWWWLRSPGYDQYAAALVIYNRGISYGGLSVHCLNGAVRPAMWIDLSYTE